LNFFAGYGNLAPKTAAGKIVTMVYAVLGVPLMLLCLSNLGQLLANAFQFAYSHMCCRRPRAPPTPPPPPLPPLPIPPPEQFKRKPPPPPPRLTPVKPLTPEVQQLLLECAEYQEAHGPHSVARALLQDPKSPHDVSQSVEHLTPIHSRSVHRVDRSLIFKVHNIGQEGHLITQVDCYLNISNQQS